MSPNTLRRWFRSLTTSKKPRRQPKHLLTSHAESVYLWDLLERVRGIKDTQEIRQEAASRRGERSRVNGFVTVDMVLNREATA